MPGFAFGPIRPNTRAGLPLTSRVLVPAVRRSLAVWVSGAAVARGIDKKGIVPATATPDPRIICRRVRSMGFSFTLNGRVHVCPRSGPSHQFNLMVVQDCCIFRAIAGNIGRRRRDGGVIASRSISWRDLAESYGHHTTNRFVRFRKSGNVATGFELVRLVWTVQKLIVDRSAITNAFGRKPSPLLRTPPLGRMMNCISG
jgi:hypothetical protein